MNKNTIIGLLLIGAVLIVYSYWMRPSEEELEAQKRKQDSIASLTIDSAKTTAKNQIDTTGLLIEEDSLGQKANASGADTLIDKDSLEKIERFNALGSFSEASFGKKAFFTIENDLLRLVFTNKGGRIYEAELKDYKTYKGEPLILFSGDSAVFSFSFFAKNRSIKTQQLFFQPLINGREIQPDANIKVSGSDEKSITMRLHTNKSIKQQNGSYIDFIYSIKGNDYMIDFDVVFNEMDNVIEPGAEFIDLEWRMDLRRQEKATNMMNGATIYYKHDKDDTDYLSESKDDEESIPTELKWVSFKQQFFSTTLIANQSFSNADVKVFDKNEDVDTGIYLRSMEALIGVPLNTQNDNTLAMSFYFGPNKYKTLRQYDLDLERQIPLGWSFFLMHWINRFAVIPVFNFLESFHLNYGIIILLLTILLKIVLFPIAFKTYKSSAKMRVLKPEIEEISKKFPKREDAMKKQQATMNLYRKAGVNPMAGCVPMLLQLPILIALFRFFPASIELRQESFLWADDLSSYDSVLDLPFSIPFYGDHVSLFTLLMTISTIIYTRLNNQMMSSSQQMPGMKVMMYIMPIMFLGIFNNYASGLSYYYLLANLITFAQMYLIRSFINEKAIRKQIEINKKKPKKASKFQQRMEEMAKRRGYNPPKRK